MQNSIFFPQSVLDEWSVEGAIDLRGKELTLLKEAKKYQLEEAVHVLKEVTGAGDPNDLVGRVKPLTTLTAKGAEVLEGSMILGENAYDVVPGWKGVPFGVELAAPDKPAADANPKSDAELLAKLLIGTMK